MSRAIVGVFASACLAITQAAAVTPQEDPPAAESRNYGYPQGEYAPSGSMREIFANTLGMVLQGVGTSVAVGLTQSIGGAILSWFQRPRPGAAGSPGPGAAPAASAGAAPALHAGVAFEVHRLADGTSVPVDPYSHVFRTGERFVVYYRPTLPGRVLVYNVNPLGEERRIDELEVAAGDLARLGPYEFRDAAGDETLRLVLVPCRSDSLIQRTRDIVRVDEVDAYDTGDYANGDTGSGHPLPLVECSRSASRSLRPRTRDIVKVETEGATSFALDSVRPEELSSGVYDAREVSIVLLHR